VVFTCVRAIHPTIITASKSKLPDGSLGFAYHSASTIILSPVLICLFFLLIALATEGSKCWRSIFAPVPLLIFGVNGVMLAMGDWLEMASLSKMHGAPYQILTQSKIIITALFMMPFKGLYQTRLQWILLISLVLAMSLYMCIHSSGNDLGSDIPVLAYVLTLLKLTLSCFDAVYTDKYAKDCIKSTSLSVMIVQTFFANSLAITIFVSSSTKIFSTGFFHGWDALAAGVTASFCVKSSLTYVVVAVLDAITKNIAECIAVLLVFLYSALSPWDDYKFELPAFLAVLLIILIIGAYVDSKQMCDKARQFDALEKDDSHS
jgi:hypothetical protein